MSVLSNYSNKFSNKIGIVKTNLDDSEVDYIVGDKVFIASNPEKTGIVTYNGVTKFSDGIWIGVALNQPLGKHNGVVQGVTYFQCDDKHGIFVRKNNLRHTIEKNSNAFQLDSFNENIDVDVQFNNSNLLKRSDDDVFVVPNPDQFSKYNLNLGDKVCVIGKSSSAQKIGILRFIGSTKFAEGTWVGIELDNPVGRNDGSVDGIRYFSCKPQYGLFALENKVQKFNLSLSRNYKNSNRMDSLSKYGSNESLSSIASNFSSASRTRVKLGLTAIGSNGRTKSENKTKHINSMTIMKESKEICQTSNAFQKVLKEKEQHVEQLIREREIERIDLATATSKIEELECQIVRLNNYNSENIDHLENKLSALQENIILINQEKEKLLEKLEEEKKKTEDLLFQIEEKNIDESYLENKTEESEHQIFELNEKLAHERDLKEALERKFQEFSENNLTNHYMGKNIVCSMELEKLKSHIINLEKQLDEEKNDSKISSMLKIIEEKDSAINDVQDRYDNLKSKLEQSLSEIKGVNTAYTDLKSNLEEERFKNVSLNREKELLETEINNLKTLVNDQNEKISQIGENLKQYKVNTQSNDLDKCKTNDFVNNISKKSIHADKVNYNKNNAEILLQERYENEITKFKTEIENFKRNKEKDLKSISNMELIIKLKNEETQEKISEIMDLKENINRIELDNINQIKLKNIGLEEKDKLCSELAAYHIQLEKLRYQITDMHNESNIVNDKLSKGKQIELNLNQDIDELKDRIDFLEKENQVLNDNLFMLENKHSDVRNSKSDMSEKITNLESQIQKLNGKLKLEKDAGAVLITKNATLYSDLEHMKQNQDEFINLNYEIDNLRSLNLTLEDEKNKLIENFDLKNKELFVVRERLLNISQEFEDLQDSQKNLQQKLDREKRFSTDKIRKLEKQLDEPDKKSQFSHSDSCNDKRQSESKEQIILLKAAKENAEEQINFLNLVIAEREKKFKVLEFENENLKEKMKDYENKNTETPIKIKKTLPPRLYCDVCEMFDIHDTEQCTVITNISPQSSPPIKIRKPKSSIKAAPRLYCDICEVFDLHNTSDCQDEQTF